MKRFMIGLIKLYKKCISPLKSPCCRFRPSCSSYAIEAFETRGFFSALLLTVGRILRCHPFAKGGYDPVPHAGFKRIGQPKSVIQCKIRRADANDQEKWNIVC